MVEGYFELKKGLKKLTHFYPLTFPYFLFYHFYFFLPSTLLSLYLIFIPERNTFTTMKWEGTNLKIDGKNMIAWSEFRYITYSMWNFGKL